MTSLPLKQGALFIDNSFLEQLQTCPRLLEYNQLHRRVLAASRPGLSFGSAIHLALEHRYKKYGTDLNVVSSAECLNEQSKILQDFFALNPPPEDNFRNLNWALDIIKHYNERYSLEPFNLLQKPDGTSMVEESVAIPFAAFHWSEGSAGDLGLRPLSALSDLRSDEIPIIYCGKVDLPILQDDRLFVLDHKTTSVLGNSFWDDLRVSPQQIGYCWGLWKTIGQKPLGFVVNAIRTSPIPAKPKNGIAAWWEETLQRNIEYLTDWHYEEWERNTLALIEEFLFHAQRKYFPLKRKWCVAKYGRCQYYEVCYSPTEQRDELLSSETYEDYTWSPLKEETK